MKIRGAFFGAVLIAPSALAQLPQLALNAQSPPSLTVMLGLALLGGLILNLMPCVLPVLSIKLLGAVSKGGRSRQEIRLGFLASATGILCAFVMLAGFVIGAKAAGAAVGWGTQFQHPFFVAALALLCVLFAANLWGLFEVGLPAIVADRVARFGDRGGLAGDFLGGAFATLLATPCSAPFLGSAIAFALTEGPAEIAAVFMAMGAGLALPYLLIASVPGLVSRLLPKPGHWMITLRRVLGFSLLGTAAWLATVIDAQTSHRTAVLICASLGALMLVLWVRRRFPGLKPTHFIVAAAGFSMLAVLAPVLLPPATSASSVVDSNTHMRTFDTASIAKLASSGRVVFVDVTADWCVTCQVNKKLVLDQAPVAAKLAGANVVTMTADWTRPSDEIAAYLASFGRYGIPFDVIYGPRAPQGIPLPVILTSEAVLDAMREAEAN